MSLTNTEKVQRVLRQLIPRTGLSNMVSKHSAMLLSGGKAISSGYNHMRSCNCNKVMLSCHAEMHALNNYFNINKAFGLKNFINDSHFTMLGRKNQSYLLRQSKVAFNT